MFQLFVLSPWYAGLNHTPDAVIYQRVLVFQTCGTLNKVNYLGFQAGRSLMYPTYTGKVKPRYIQQQVI